MSIEANPAAAASRESPATIQAPTDAPVVRPEHAEGEIARLIEQQAAKIPSHWFLFSALGALSAAMALELGGHTRASRFISLWPSPLLVLGLYTKMVKTFGSR